MTWAKIIDEKTKRCLIGIGDDDDFYTSEGYIKAEVEQGYDGWYISGYAPEKPEEIRKNEEIDTLKSFLKETDWIVVKIAEKQMKKDEKGSDEDLKKYADTLKQREAARARINELEKEEEK